METSEWDYSILWWDSSRVSPEQLELLLSFMEEHVDFAAGKQSVYSRFSASKLWRLLAERLNAAAADSGGARKSPDRWCRYWADIKYKARKKSAAGGALGDLSLVEERLRNILDAGGGGGGGAGGGGRLNSHSDDEREQKFMVGGRAGAGMGMEEDACSDTSLGGGGGGVEGGARLSTEELLAEAAMRTALAAEKQAEAVAQGVELLRELVGVVRAGLPPAPPPPPPPQHAPHAPHPPLHHDPHDQHQMQVHHHHRL
ncbi:hypothetical protein NE865_03876 [Phthorimaea operculella]|nr:hypothetical protein NE865_03876 [Phthorimaea operculella]